MQNYWSFYRSHLCFTIFSPNSILYAIVDAIQFFYNRHVSNRDKVGKPYRSQTNMFSIDDDGDDGKTRTCN